MTQNTAWSKLETSIFRECVHGRTPSLRVCGERDRRATEVRRSQRAHLTSDMVWYHGRGSGTSTRRARFARARASALEGAGATAAAGAAAGAALAAAAATAAAAADKDLPFHGSVVL